MAVILDMSANHRMIDEIYVPVLGPERVYEIEHLVKTGLFVQLLIGKIPPSFHGIHLQGTIKDAMFWHHGIRVHIQAEELHGAQSVKAHFWVMFWYHVCTLSAICCKLHCNITDHAPTNLDYLSSFKLR